MIRGRIRSGAERYTRVVEPREPAFLTVSLDPNPAIRPVLEQVIAATLDFAKGQK